MAEKSKKKFRKINTSVKSAIDEDELDLKKDIPDEDAEKVSKRLKSDAQRGYMHAAAKRGEISEDVVEEFEEKTPKGADLPSKVKKKKMKKSYTDNLNDFSKALSSIIASSIARRARMEHQMEAYHVAQEALTPPENGIVSHDPDVPAVAGIAEEQPLIGTTRERQPGEPMVVPVRRIHTPLAVTPVDAEVFKSCITCGHMHKSLSCNHCEIVAQTEEAGPLWSR